MLRFRRRPKFYKNWILDALALVVGIMLFKLIWKFGAIILPIIFSWYVLLPTAIALGLLYVFHAKVEIYIKEKKVIANGNWFEKANRQT